MKIIKKILVLVLLLTTLVPQSLVMAEEFKADSVESTEHVRVKRDQMVDSYSPGSNRPLTSKEKKCLGKAGLAGMLGSIKGGYSGFLLAGLGGVLNCVL